MSAPELRKDAGLKLAGAVPAVVAWLVILAWMIPSRVISRGDDFGYLDCVVETVRTHRWAGSDWLAPLNLPLTLLSAGGYWATGNFYLSTYGINLVLGGLNLVLLARYLRPAIESDTLRWWTALALCLVPVWLNKAVGYTGIPLGVACTLAAWLAWRRRWLGCFFAAVIVGLLNRQSAVCLLAWPLVALVRGWRARTGVDGRLVTGIFVTLAVTAGATLAAPPSWAREVVNRQMPAALAVGQLGANLAVALVVLVAVKTWWEILGGEDVVQAWRRNLARPWLPLGCTLAGAALVLGKWGEVHWETPGMEAFGLVVLVAAIGSGAWLNRWDRWPAAEVLVFIGGYVALVLLRGVWWDYYFLEPALALLTAGAVVTAGRAQRTGRLAVFLLLGLAGTIYLQRHIRDEERITVAYEQALRRGELWVSELSDAPFGYLGWKLFATARQSAGATTLIDFLKYVEGSRARYADGAITVNRAGGRKSIHPSRERWPLPEGYVGRTFPLDNAEWRAFLGSPAR